MSAWQGLETNHLCFQLPLHIFHLDPMCCHAKKSHLRHICWPSIRGNGYFSWSYLCVTCPVSSLPSLRDNDSLTDIASFSSPICFMNLLWSWTFTSYELGRSVEVDFGLMETRALRKAGLSASARGCRCVISYFFRQRSTLKLYLVVCSDQLSYSLKSTRPHEFVGTHHRCEVQQLLCFLLRHLASLCLLLLFLHGLPNVLWNRPMSHRYARIFAFLLVDFVVLTNMKMTAWIPSFVECLALPIQFRELLIIPAMW